MIAAAAISGWGAATVAALAALLGWRRLAGRMELVARVAHEVRSPLAAARLGIELGARGGELSAARLRAIDLELGRAALVIEDLTLTRPANAQPGHRQRVDIGQLLLDSVEAWRATAVARRVALDVQWSAEGVYVAGDRRRLAQATGNLIANAIEHGGGAVAVRGRVDQGAVRIEVIDGGPGLPAPMAELARRPHGGRGRRGRGLAIATAVAEAHGGRLAAAPSQRGARIVLELPVSAGGTRRAPVAG